MPEPLVVVDGNNVMGSRPDGWWRDRAGAARRLVGHLGVDRRPRGVEQAVRAVALVHGEHRLERLRGLVDVRPWIAQAIEAVGDGRHRQLVRVQLEDLVPAERC